MKYYDEDAIHALLSWKETVDALPAAEVVEGPDLLLKGARVMTAAGTILETGDVLVIDGRIQEVAASITAPEGVEPLR